jgi:hypothetical protein
MKDPHSNPDWYRVKYTLAAEYANWSMEPKEARPASLVNAEREARELLGAAWSKLEGDQEASGGVRGTRNLALDDMLRRTVVPSALILLAGVLLAEQGGDETARKTEHAGKLDPAQVRNLVVSGKSVSPFSIVELVESQPSLSRDTLYNLACFYAQAGDFDLAIEHLRSVLRDAPASGRRVLVGQMQRDPVLRPVMRKFRRELSDEVNVADLETDDVKRSRPWI